VYVKAIKPQIKQAMKKFYDTDMDKASSLVEPYEKKKAHFPLTPDHNALDVTQKIKIIKTETI
jgi:large subunit ribosomal protein L23Ae